MELRDPSEVESCVAENFDDYWLEGSRDLLPAGLIEGDPPPGDP